MLQYLDTALQKITTTFKVVLVLSQLVAVSCVILVIYWCKVNLGGFSGPTDNSNWFNWHPLLMTLGLIITQGESILVYRVLRNRPKLELKYIHGILHLTAFVLVVFGLKAVFESHNLSGKPNLYSLHSWVGLTAVVLFCIQYVVGFLAFVVPGVRTSLSNAFRPFHVFCGTVIFALSITAAVMGVTERLANGFYPELVQTTRIGNSLGILLLVFGVSIVYLVGKDTYKRPPGPEEVENPLYPPVA